MLATGIIILWIGWKLPAPRHGIVPGSQHIPTKVLFILLVDFNPSHGVNGVVIWRFTDPEVVLMLFLKDDENGAKSNENQPFSFLCAPSRRVHQFSNPYLDGLKKPESRGG